MEFLHEAWNFFLNLLRDTGGTLDMLVTEYGVWVYAILFLIIFCETGLVVTPFLPGDSLLFLAGAIAVRPDNPLHIYFLVAILIIAAIIGDAVNYTIGRFFGEKLFSNPKSKIFKQEYLEKTNKFYEKHGGKTIILARFVPIVRTFAPFVAGMGRMSYKHFFSYNVIGGIAWVVIFCTLGALIGRMEWVEKNLDKVVIIIVVVSILPAIYEVIKAKWGGQKEVKAEE
ncbi:DedA family protein [Dysgonomonas sp. Marseille-P4677]|uniref:DedA family protein n=1 Tax=Dysgonomonas sp. Marseille-P4677 TaxID=2364790 RepID=UPI00191164E0|nr:DedA family protein [Dysgonomonas sp. Marseille-P4677]MBK5722751.1 DedA family protein [Dysgonomonas sp. Marseille-P4677]